jgi:RHS repeat-associated protein
LTSPGGYATAWLNADRGRILGPANTQEVAKGDSVEIQVFGKYVDAKKVRLLPASLLPTKDINNVAQQLAELGQQATASGGNQLLTANVIALVLSDLHEKRAPEAFMGYALYDADSNLYEKGKILLSKKARNEHEELKTRIFVPEDGFMRTFLVNETSENVWFDQFSILTTTPVILQETHYDPWGVELQGLGYQQGGIKANKYLYNGKEFNDHLGINLSDYGARMYDASIGRWFVVDPLAEIPSQIAHSPYAYAWNNPISMIDPTGMSAEECKDCPEPKDGDKDAGTGLSEVVVTAKAILPPPDFSAINKSNQNSQAGWGGGSLVGSVLEKLSEIEIVTSVTAIGLNQFGDSESTRLYQNGFRRGLEKNYQLSGRNLRLFGNQSMTLTTMPYSAFSQWGNRINRISTLLSLSGMGYNTYRFVYAGDPSYSGGRYSYHMSTSSIAFFVGRSSLGLTGGGVVGVAAVAGEMWYDLLIKYVENLGSGLGSMQYQLKRGWNPNGN